MKSEVAIFLNFSSSIIDVPAKVKVETASIDFMIKGTNMNIILGHIHNTLEMAILKRR